MQQAVQQPSANDTQVGGDHYKGVAYQHWDWATDLALRGLEYAATKYLTRLGKKDQASVELGKAVHYLQKLIEVFNEMRMGPRLGSKPGRLAMLTARFVDGLDGISADRRVVNAIYLVAFWEEPCDLALAISYLQELQSEQEKSEAEVSTQVGYDSGVRIGGRG